MNPEDAYSRRRFLRWGVGTLVVLGGCTGAATQQEDGNSTTAGPDTSCTTGNATSTDSTTSAAESTTRTEAGTASVRIGDLVEGENLSMVVREATTTDSLGEFSNPDAGNEFVVVRMAVKNTSSEYVDFSSFLQSRVKDSQNRVYDSSFESTDHPIQSGVLAPGEVARGDVVFEVPTDVGDLTMQFDFSAFDLFEFERVTVDLAATAESVADLSQSLAVDVHSPGETASHQNVSVTLHGVRRATSVGEFDQAEDGTEYVIPDFEITNETSEPLTVSSLLQMQVKDHSGLAYDSDIGASSSLDSAYSEGSDIAAGESRRGELAYQVPVGESCLYWAFNFYSLLEPQKAFWRL